jgi:hypothetical protein
MARRSTQPAGLPSSALGGFLGLTFLITWGLIGVYVVFPESAAATLGEISGSHPVFFVATWSPAIAAFGVVFLHFGRAGIRAFLSRLLLWRCSWGWAAFILIGLPLVLVAGCVQGWIHADAAAARGADPVVAVLFMIRFLGPSRRSAGAA